MRLYSCLAGFFAFCGALLIGGCDYIKDGTSKEAYNPRDFYIFPNDKDELCRVSQYEIDRAVSSARIYYSQQGELYDVTPSEELKYGSKFYKKSVENRTDKFLIDELNKINNVIYAHEMAVRSHSAGKDAVALKYALLSIYNQEVKKNAPDRSLVNIKGNSVSIYKYINLGRVGAYSESVCLVSVVCGQRLNLPVEYVAYCQK